MRNREQDVSYRPIVDLARLGICIGEPLVNLRDALVCINGHLPSCIHDQPAYCWQPR